MALDYLTLVNTAISEAGVDLDLRTSDNFAFPPKSKMYDRFKQWVNRAWTEMQTDNLDWGLTQSRSVAVMYPRLTVRGVTGSFLPGDTITDEGGNVYGTVVRIRTRADGLFSLDLDSMVGGTPKLATKLLTPAGSFCFYVYTGEYSIHELAPDIEDLNRTELWSGTGDTGGDRRVLYVPFSAWNNNSWMINSAATNIPSVYTVNSQRMIEFLPSIANPVYLGFSYSKAPFVLINWNDTLKDLPDRFALAVVWRAVMSYADYERDASLKQRANTQYHRIIVYADISLGEHVSVGGWNV